MNLLFQVDGKLPNFALARLSAYLKQRLEPVVFSQNVSDLMFLETPQRVFASSIFTEHGRTRREQLAGRFPDAITGGTGYRFKSLLNEVITDEDPDSIVPDYSHWPNFDASMGYSQRGCRLDCGFCRMKTREGAPRNVATIGRIWRGDPYPKHIHLLDNDFFGQEEWRGILIEARDGGFKICFNQGINIRLINHEQARELVQTGYWDDSFKTRRLYTAWDMLGDEKAFRSGVAVLTDAGIPAKHLMVYMLIGWRKGETEKEALYRFNEMVALGCRPYPMVYDRSKLAQCRFQKWAIRRYYEVCSWEDFKNHHKERPEWNQSVNY